MEAGGRALSVQFGNWVDAFGGRVGLKIYGNVPGNTIGISIEAAR